MASNVSNDLIWSISRKNSAFRVARPNVELSRNPLNVTGRYSRVQEGLVNDKAIGIQAAPQGGLVVLVKLPGKANKPASGVNSYTIPASTSSRKAYRSIVNSTAKRGYRAELNKAVVARASKLIAGSRPTKADPAEKLRGAKARAAEQ